MFWNKIKMISFSISSPVLRSFERQCQNINSHYFIEGFENESVYFSLLMFSCHFVRGLTKILVFFFGSSKCLGWRFSGRSSSLLHAAPKKRFDSCSVLLQARLIVINVIKSHVLTHSIVPWSLWAIVSIKRARSMYWSLIALEPLP